MENQCNVPSVTGFAIRSRNKLGQYPSFVREGDNLVKIGWSKTQKAEYEHKSPKRLLAVLCES
jgi:hypothetical protein